MYLFRYIYLEKSFTQMILYLTKIQLKGNDSRSNSPLYDTYGGKEPFLWSLYILYISSDVYMFSQQIDRVGF